MDEVGGECCGQPWSRGFEEGGGDEGGWGEGWGREGQLERGGVGSGREGGQGNWYVSRSSLYIFNLQKLTSSPVFASAASLQTLHLASAILLRLSLLPPAISAPTPTLPSLITLVADKLFALESTISSASLASPTARSTLWASETLFVPTKVAEGAAWTGTVESLWRATLQVGAGEVEAGTMERLSGRVMVQGGGEVGGWVRREWVATRIGA